MKHEINSRGMHKWRLYNEHDYIMTNNLYQKFCDNKGIEFTIPQKISYWDGKFEPTNFIELLKKFENVLLIDSDWVVNDSEYNIVIDYDDIHPGIHFNQMYKNKYGVENWYNMKNLEYFYNWIPHILYQNDELVFPSESLIFVRRHQNWEKFKDLIVEKYMKISVNNDILYFSNPKNIDTNSYQPYGRCEGVSYVFASYDSNFPLFYNNKVLHNLQLKMKHIRFLNNE
jgi:hypothetical protein